MIMRDDTEYSSAERAGLWILAFLGFAVMNGIFVYTLLFRRADLSAALANPVSLAFIVEALILAFVLGWLLQKWRVSHLGWGWFVTLSLLGSMAFALPVVLLWRRRSPEVGR
jgi:hypothetical protein